MNKATYPHADLLYFFDNKTGRLGKLSDWRLVYQTPGKIVTVRGHFEFKDLPLR